jgi:hypothetical protein
MFGQVHKTGLSGGTSETVEATKQHLHKAQA